MAVKDLAIFKLFGSVFSKGEKIEEKEPDAVLYASKKIAKSETEEEVEVEDRPKHDTLPENKDTHHKLETDNESTESVEIKSDEIKKEPKKKSKAKKTETKTKNSKKTATKKSVTKKTTTKKEPTGSKKAAKIKLYTEDIKKHLGSVDDDFLAIVVKNLGPSIYRKDAELVSCSDSKELDTVRKNFLIKKLGFDKSEQEMLDGEIQKVCEVLKGVRTKYRATFYYMLAKNLNKESALS